MSEKENLRELDRYIDEIYRLRVLTHAVFSLASDEGNRIYTYLKRQNQQEMSLAMDDLCNAIDLLRNEIMSFPIDLCENQVDKTPC